MATFDLEEQPESRFFTSEEKGSGEGEVGEGGDLEEGGEEDDAGSEEHEQKCLTLRLLQRCLPFFQSKSVWDPSQGDLTKTQVVHEVKYPAVLTLLERPFCEFIFVFTSIFSVVLLLFSEAFLLESRIVWGIIHVNNFIYTFCVFGSWLDILVKSKYARTKQGFSTTDTCFSLLGVIPVDIVVLVIHILNDNVGATNPVTPWITVSRLLYFFRLRNVFQYFAKWEDQLAFGDFKMFLIKITVYGLFLIHLLACCWHRIACEPFTMSHFLMRPSQATADVCMNNSWVTVLVNDKNFYNWDTPLLRHGWNVLLEHYLVSFYWAVVTVFRLGASDITASLNSEWEIAFTSVTQILSWIFVIAYISGSLTSILVEMDTEKENFITRRFAIERYLDFSDVTKEIRSNVNRFYDYLWARSRGIHNWDLVEQMPYTMKAEIYYDVNKFVLDQLPLLANLEEAFLMNLSVQMKHAFYLRGEVLQRRGENGGAMYYVINGHLDILHDDEVSVIAEIRSGSAIGELYLLQSYPVVTTVRCGSECDIMVLNREDCKKVLQMYPDYKDTLQKRIDSRLEQSGLLLALCDKHNEYSTAYAKLHKLQHSRESGVSRDSYFRQSYGMISNVMDSPNYQDSKGRQSEDYDGLNLGPEAKSRLEKLGKDNETKEKKPSLSSVMAGISLAIENDVARAASLAKDLNISRPPLVVKAPTKSRAPEEDHEAAGVTKAGDSATPTTTPITIKKTKTFSFIMFPNFSSPTADKGGGWICWKFIVLLSIIWVLWYYPYCFAFANHPISSSLPYISHIFDLIFLLDFILDTLQHVVLPHKTLESWKEIVGYRMKTFYFYIRIFAFIPWEYILGPMISLDRDNHFFYLLKFNRIILYFEGMKFFRTFDGDARVPPEFLFIIRFAIRLFFSIHAASVCFEIVLKDVAETPDGVTVPKIKVLDYPDKRFYEYVFYWACQVMTGTGFGDFPLRDDHEIAITVIGVIVGVSMIVYLNARLSAIMANAERRRVAFKQTFYSLMTFMRERRFGQKISDRVKEYYKLQWKSHEGVLIHGERSAIWDAPKTLFHSVSFAQAQKYVARIPLFMYCSDALLIEVCSALRQYIVQPKEVLLYPSDQTRELYIIVKGYCNVTREGRVVGRLGEGNYFGMNGLLYGTNRPFGIQTVNYCEFFCLEFSSFVEITKRHSKFLTDYKLLRGDATLPKGIDLAIPPEEWIVFPKIEPELEHSSPEPTPTTSSLNTGSRTTTATDSSSLDPGADFPPTPTSGRELEAPVSRWGRLRVTVKTSFIQGIIPYGRFLRIWTIFRVVAAFLVGNFVPVQASFSVDPSVAFGVVFFFDIVAWIDLVICFRIGHYGVRSQLITSWRGTMAHYFWGPFILDLVACFPFELLIVICSPSIKMFGVGRTYGNHYHLISSLRINRMLQCYRLFVMGRLLSKTIFKSLSLLILLQVVPLMATFLNVMNCLAVVSVCGPSLNGEPIQCEPWAWILNGDLFRDAPVEPATLMEDPGMSYIIGLHWILSAALCVGFGDIDVIGHETNRKIAIVVIYLGVVVTGYLVSKLTACLVGEDSRKISIREKTKVMFRFLEQFGVPKDLCRRAKEYYFGAWDKTKGIFPKDLFSALHPSLKSDVMKSLYEDRLKLSPIFLSTDDPGIRILASKLLEMFYPEGEFLFEYGDLNGDVYFIAKGLVATYTERGDKILSYVGSGSIIGEISCLFEVQRQYTAVAATDCEIYMFRKEDFLDFLSLYPSLKTTLEEACIRHYKETMEAAAAASKTRVRVTSPSDDDVEAALLPRSRPIKDNRYQDFKSVTSLSNVPTKGTSGGRSGGTDASLKGTETLGEGAGVDFASAKELTIAECENDPEFIYDPLRVPASSFLVNERKNRGTGGRGKKAHWTAYFISFGKVPRDEMGFLHFLQEKSKIRLCNAVIHPLSPICSWVSFFLLLTSLSCGLTAYEIAFHTLEESTNLLILRFCVEIFFLIRFIGNFYLGFYDEYGVIVSDNGKVLKRYFASPGGFCLDLITTFPFYLISHLVGGFRKAEIAADIRGLQLLRVFLFARYLKETETNMRMKLSRVKIIKVSILLCFIFHFCACSWYLVACDGLVCRRGSWMSILMKDMINDNKISSGEEISIGSRYLLSLYYVTTAITFTGLSDITPRTRMEICSTIAMIFTTVFVIGFLVGEMTQCLAAQVKSKIHFRHKLHVMEHHFQALGLSTPKLNNVRRYFKLLWLRCNGNPYTQILAQLPYALRADITMKVYGPNIKNVCKLVQKIMSRILGKLEDVIVRQLSARVKHEIFMPGAYIIRAGDVCSSVYFIKKGEVVILDEKANMQLCVDVLYENECFGEVKVLLPVKEQFQFCYVARLETELGVLSGDDMVDVLGRHGGVLESVVTKADQLKAQRIAKKDEEDRIGFLEKEKGQGSSSGVLGVGGIGSETSTVTSSRH